jgi:hypothetical protein
MKLALSVSLLAGAVTGLAACRDVKVCAGVGVPDRVTPSDTSIAVGTSFTAMVETGGYCLPGDASDARYTRVAVTCAPELSSDGQVSRLRLGRDLTMRGRGFEERTTQPGRTPPCPAFGTRPSRPSPRCRCRPWVAGKKPDSKGDHRSAGVANELRPAARS